MIKSIERIDIDERYMLTSPDIYIGWCLTKHCTFKCSYCIYSCKSDNIFSTKEQLDICINYLNSISTRKSWIAVYGGEPTTHPLFNYAMLKYIGNVKIYTNLYRNLSFWEQLLHSGKQIKILTSIHPKRTNIEELHALIKIFLSYDNVTVEIKCMFTSEDDKLSLNTYFEFYELLHSNEKFRILPRTIYHDNKWYFSDEFLCAREHAGKDLLFKITYTDNTSIIIDKYDDQFNNGLIFEHNNFNKILCDAGLKYISITEDFSIYPCCRYDKDFYNQKPLGNALVDTPKIHKTICKLPYCNPPEEDFILKRFRMTQ